MNHYDAGHYNIIVVGAGHAGCEAALACSRLGAKTLLTTINLDGIALMACNPAIGGTAKGHLVREIDALGGQMALTADETLIQIKMLNTAKGPAVHSLRAQQDKKLYQQSMKKTLENTENLTLTQAEVVDILVGSQSGASTPLLSVITATGAKYTANAVVLATGVYLKSRVIIGEFTQDSGPSGLLGANHLTDCLIRLGFSIRRFKTGTPARVDRRSLDFSKMQVENGDSPSAPFSFMSPPFNGRQVECYLTYTNERTHEVIRRNLHRSPLYSGQIEGTGPRYCPSIEDKIVKFPDKKRHQLFLEPEGADTNEMYVQGMSSSLPEDVQKELYRTIAGMENAEFMRPAYAIEYDCIDPTGLKLSLESKQVAGLFCAGQINGSSGYEEAATQGLIAGINAVRFTRGETPLVLGRDEAYTGVLIDDLVTKGTSEPYRMMTARAEYRLLLRQDNADMRLTDKGREVGLVDDVRWKRFLAKKHTIEVETARLKNTRVSGEPLKKFLEQKNMPSANSATLYDLLKRPEVHYGDFAGLTEIPELYGDTLGQLETAIKYEGYIEKQRRTVDEFRRLEDRKLPSEIDYSAISGLRIEARQKLSALKPESVGQAARISGVTPADIAVLLVYLRGAQKN